MRCEGLKAAIPGAALMLALISTAVSAAPLRIDRLCGPPGMRLGMSVEDWKQLGFDGAGPGVVQPICSDEPAAANYLGVKTQAAPGEPIVCGYADRIGSVFLDDSVSLPSGYAARRLRYYFQAGRLAKIDCLTSDDAFDAVRARFDKLYGPSQTLVRDQMHTEIGPRARVKERWLIPGGSVTLVDPVKSLTDLSLEYRTSGS